MIEMINETTAIVTALPPSDREFNEYCDFYRLELSDGTLSLLAPYDACVGSSAEPTPNTAPASPTRQKMERFISFPPSAISPTFTSFP